MIAGAEHCGPGGCKLRIAGVSKVFDGRRGKVVALEGINLNIRGGEFVCLVGASGCGEDFPAEYHCRAGVSFFRGGGAGRGSL